jgi:hypothetical protein
VKVLPSKWEDEQTSVASGQSLTLCGSLALTLHAEDKAYNAFTYDKVNKECVVAKAVCHDKDFDTVGAKEIYLMLVTEEELKAAVLVIGGSTTLTSVQIWTPGGDLTCNLPLLPRAVEIVRADMVDGSVTACDSGCFKVGTVVTCDSSCIKLGGSDWVDGPSTLKARRYHTSDVLPDGGLLLVGGTQSKHTTEIISPQGVSTEAFRVDPERRYHCSIQTHPGTIVLTGGYYGSNAKKSVKEYSNIQGQEATVREFPDLNQARHLHACGMYTVGDKKVRVLLPIPLLSTLRCSSWRGATVPWTPRRHLTTPPPAWPGP